MGVLPDPAAQDGLADTLEQAMIAGGTDEEQYQPDVQPDEDLDEDAVEEEPRRGSRAWLTVLGALLLVIGLVLAGWGGYRWTQTQYYVGEADGQVAVFRGIPATAGPLTFSTPVELTGTRVDELPGFVADRVHETIRATSLEDARGRADRLIEDGAAETEPSSTPTLPHARTAHHERRAERRLVPESRRPARTTPARGRTDDRPPARGERPGPYRGGGAARHRAGARHGRHVDGGLLLEDGLPEGFWTYTIVLAALAFTAHIVLRLRAPYADQVILPAVVLLNSVSMAMILRQDLSTSRARTRPATLMWTALGIVLACAVIFVIRDHRSLRRLRTRR